MRVKVLLALLAALLVWGIATLTLLRFDTGAAYPAYSSFRADPQGTKALHEALSDLATLTVARNFEPLSAVAVDRDTTLIVAGMDARSFVDADNDPWPTLRALAAAGARVVVAFEPTNSHASSQEGGEARAGQPVLQLAFSPLAENDQGLPVPAPATLALDTADSAPLPASILCHTGLWFDRLDANWRTVYSREGHSVVIERRVGNGTVVLVADAVPLSNHGVSFSRESQLLTWILGDARHVVFDETHLGVTAPDGTMALVWRYRLQGVLATLVVLALLFAWRAGSPLLPAPTSTETQEEVSGRDAAAGVAGLLRRGLPPRQLLAASVETWRAGTSPPPALAATVRALAQSGEDPVASYRRIRATLRQHQLPHSHHGDR